MDNGRIELIFVIVVMFLLFLGGVGASLLFIRQYRREHKQKKR